MSKKKRGERGDLLSLKVLAEQRWAYERVLEHLTYAEMRRRVWLPAPRGLGYDLSEQQLKGLVRGYRDRLAETEEHSLEEHRERELADLATITRAAKVQLAQAAATGVLDKDAAALLVKTSESRRKLLGLDAPQQLKAEVLVRDAVTEELNEMLARAGKKPVKVDP